VKTPADKAAPQAAAGRAVALQAAHAQLVQRCGDGLFAFDAGGRLTVWNPAMEQLTGKRAASVLGHDIRVAFPEAETAVATVFGGHETTCRIGLAGGRPHDAHVSPLRGLDGAVAGGCVVLRDGGAGGEPSRPALEARLRDTLAAARVGAWHWPVPGVQIWRSEDHDCLYGFARNEGEWTTDRLLGLVHPDDVAGVQSAIAHALTHANEVVSEYRVVWPDGNVRWLLARGRMQRNGAGDVISITGATMDVTKSKQAEVALQLSRERIDLVIHSTGVGVWYCDLPSQRLVWSDRVRLHFGLDADREISNPVFYSLIHPDDRERVRQAAADTYAHNARYDVEYRTTAADGSVRWLRDVGRIFRDENGTPARFDGINIDVTTRKQTEEALQRAVAARDDFLSVASHELRTPVTGIQLQTQMLLRSRRAGQPTPEPRLDAFLAGLEAQLHRLNRLVDDMLDVGRIGTGKLQMLRERFDLSQALTDVLERYGPLLEQAACRLHVDIAPAVTGHWDRGRLEQAIVNVLGNAVRYAPGRPVHVRLHTPAGRAVVEIRDEGPGVSPEHQARIFERFERAVPPSEVSGLGLGLYITRSIMQAHSGDIALASAPGEGATFILSLPLPRE
jgi:PAS domain S-box-containing protein